MKKVEIKQGEKKEEKGKNKKKIGVVIGIMAGVLVVVGGGIVGMGAFLKREIVETEELIAVERGAEFSQVFREYVEGRLEMAELFSREFRSLQDEKILDKLAEVKEVFAGVMKETGASYKETEFSEMAEIMASDTRVYLREIQKMRQVLAGEGESADKQVELLKIMQEDEGVFRSAVYRAENAFEKGESGLATKGILLYRGEMMVEVGGGVMNVFVGDKEKIVTAVTTDDYAETVKTILAEKAFGIYSGGVVKLGAGVKDELTVGKLKIISTIETSMMERRLEKRMMSLIGETTWSLVPKLKDRGIEGGLVAEEGKVTEKTVEGQTVEKQ